MKFVKGTEKEFVKLFGRNGLELLNKHKGNVYLAKTGDFPMLDAVSTEAPGCVLRVDPQTKEVFPQESEGVISLILFPERIRAARVLIAQSSELTGAALDNEVKRFYLGTLIHELTHVKQMNDGRMNQMIAGVIEWEGSLYNTTVENHIGLPWEREAYLAQYAVMLGSEKKAEQAFSLMLEAHGIH